MIQQDQSVEEGGQGYQAARDITIHRGMTPSQMSEVMIALAAQLQGYFAEADRKAEERYSELRDSLLEEFAKDGTKAQPEAFAEPDYQRVVRDAHEAFARSGDEALKVELVRLLTERSAQPTGTRKALVLNEAIRVAGSLTRQEYAGLAIIFLLKYVSVHGLPRLVVEQMASFVSPFLDDLPADGNSYDYLASMRCITPSAFGQGSLWEILHRTYSSEFSFGFTREELERAIGADGNGAACFQFTKAASAHLGGNLRFDAQSPDELRAKLVEANVGPEALERLMALFERTRRSEAEIREEFSSRRDIFDRLADLWDKTPLSSATLTALGKALAHSALISRTQFNAPVEIWVN